MLSHHKVNDEILEGDNPLSTVGVEEIWRGIDCVIYGLVCLGSVHSMLFVNMIDDHESKVLNLLLLKSLLADMLLRDLL